MINLAVINKKDLIKYIIKLVVAIIIVAIFSGLLSKNNIKHIKINLMNKESLIACLDETIPGIKQLNSKEEQEEKIKEIEPLKLALRLEIEMMDNMKLKEKKDEDIQMAQNSNEQNSKEEVIEHADIGLSTQVIENNVPNKFTNTHNGVNIKNETQYNLTEEMLKPDITIESRNVLIFHTHTCESYTATEQFNYIQTGTYRTTDLNYNVARVGMELKNQLISYNYNVIHDTTYHDYPAYSGSYGRSLTTVQNLLTQNQNTDVVIDLHRDAIGDYSYAPTVKIGEDYAAQLMFVIGTDGGGLEHPNWNQNLKFAIKIQEKANELYPGLFKPIILRNTRYNQHVAKGASIIEVGATGNTMEQCLNSMKYLAKVISEVIK